ncbi:hypothetical protein BDK88_1645 [Natrinema hispanicum]|uniref:DUF2178 domain-containing protein n=1 Tax=Natrinema hispanicum TaxID=392421 RepID=A0A482YAT5_9EURY|nr:hypothetical protein [Natrinema hispanicum]RZV10478.1 hypothetical protein BDK88_1645 [Natrinema hispanicum]
MSELPENIQRQKRNGYLMLVRAVFTLGVTVATVQYYELSPISYLGGLVPVGILVFFGYRAISAGREEKALGDERTQQLYGKVGINSFWFLMSVLIVDMAFSIFPEDSATSIYVWVGLACYGLYFVYYRYVE